MTLAIPVPEPPFVFTDAEKKAWAPPEDILPADWAAKYRVLTTSSRGRRWYNENSPPIAVIMNLAARKTVRELWLMKAAQIGGSEGVRNILGWLAGTRPCVAIVVLPNAHDGRKIIRKEYFPLIRETPELAKLMTGRKADFKLTFVWLRNGFELNLAWSGSASALASLPSPRIFLDEVDKYDDQAGREANPIDLARVRMRTYEGECQLIGLSTPTLSTGNIATQFDDCPIQLYYFVPCPHCGHHQRLVRDQLKWEHHTDIPEPKLRAAKVLRDKAAWFECVSPTCRGRITEQHKREVVQAGFYATLDLAWKLYPDGREEGEQPIGERVGVHLPACYDFQTPWHRIAADTIEAGRDPAKLMHLYNSTWGEPFRLDISPAHLSTFAAKCVPNAETGFVPPPRLVVPPWASRVLITADSQKDYFWFIVRAWGADLRSQRLHHGRAPSFADLEELMKTEWRFADETIQPLRAHRLGIDSGGGTETDGVDTSRTDEVYRWCRLDPIFRLPLKGSSRAMVQLVHDHVITYTPPGRKRDPYDMRLWLVEPTLTRDLLTSMIGTRLQLIDKATGEMAEVDQWSLNEFNDEEYNRHLSNVVKERFRKKAGTYVERYVPRPGGGRYDYHDCEAYQIALARGMDLCTTLPTLDQLTRQREGLHKPAVVKPTGIRRPDGRSFFANKR